MRTMQPLEARAAAGQQRPQSSCWVASPNKKKHTHERDGWRKKRHRGGTWERCRVGVLARGVLARGVLAHGAVGKGGEVGWRLTAARRWIESLDVSP